MVFKGGGKAGRLLVLLHLALVCLPGCSSNVATTPVPEAGSDHSRLEVRRGGFQQTFLLTGELEAVTGAPLIIPRTPSWNVPVKWILEDGSRVGIGDKVVELDATEILGDLDQKRIAEIAAHNEITRKEADIEIQAAEKDLAVERARIAVEKARLEAEIPEEIRTRREYQEAQLAFEKARVAHEKTVEERSSGKTASVREKDNLRIGLEKAQREIGIAEEAINNMTLRAPREGLFVVGENRREGRKWQDGDTAWVGAKVAEIPDLSSMLVQARLSDVDDGRIAPGLAAVCTMDTYPDMQIEGRVREIGVIAQARSYRSMRRFFPVTIDLETSDPEIMRPGMSVRVEVLTVNKDDVLVAPRIALDMEEEKPLLLLAGGSNREVLLGPCNTLECVIEDGAVEGELLRTGSRSLDDER